MSLQPNEEKGESGLNEPEQIPIPITKVQLSPIDGSGPTKAIRSVTFAGSFVVHGVRVVSRSQ